MEIHKIYNEYYWYGGNEIKNDSIIFHIPLHIMQPTVQTNVEYVILNIPMKRLFASDQDVHVMMVTVMLMVIMLLKLALLLILSTMHSGKVRSQIWTFLKLKLEVR